MSTRSGRIRTSGIDSSPPKIRPSRSPGRLRRNSPARKSPPPRQIARKSPAKKTVSPSRKTLSPSRKTLSPSRKTLSPSRKTLSPSRKPPSKFPVRKSPSRTTKEIQEPIAPAPPKSPNKRPALKSDVTVRLQNLTSQFTANTRSRRTTYSVEDITSSKSEIALDRVNGIEPLRDNLGLRNRRSVEAVPPRRSSRLRDFIDIPEVDIRRSSSKSISQSKSVSQSIDTYSDEDLSADEHVKEKSKSVTRKLSTPLRNSINIINDIANRYEFGGRVGTAALVLLIPLTVVTILSSCMKQCSINTLITFSPFKSLWLWSSIPATIAIAVQVILQALLTFVPILGRRAEYMDNTKRKRCFNGLFAAIFTVALVYSLDYLQIIKKDALLKDFLRLATASYIFAVLLSVSVYISSRNANKNDLNPYGNTGYVIYDFFIGSEIHPHFMKLDIKLWISRICNISTLILSSLIFTQGIKLHLKENENLNITNHEELLRKITLQPTILVFSMMQIIYILSYIIREYRIASTFFWQSEGVGYMQTVSSALYPFYFTTLAKYVSDTNLMLSTNVLLIACGLFIVGFIIMLASNSIKHEFRRDPLQPGFANLESMPTFHGNKLLTAGLWGILRHPNYTGDIIIHIALSLPGILTGEFIAASPAFITILVLLHRAWRDHARCKRRYGAAWQRYCKKVPSVIIPKVL